MAKLLDDLKMTKPFSQIEHEASLSIMRTSDLFSQMGYQTLKPFDLTPPQFNVLRILRGSPDGLSCGQIAERMITRDPDITRLLDRLESRRLIARERSVNDRRVVLTRISSSGLELLRRLDPVMADVHKRQFRNMSEKQLRQLIDLLDTVRESFDEHSESTH